jgi:pimeloyl-ACP methyl ester carboxylesterase
VDLAYVDQGTGAPVVFVHGSFSDFRIWERQRPALAQSYRFIAYNQRDHGPEPWPDEGKYYSAVTHAADLAAFLGALQATKVLFEWVDNEGPGTFDRQPEAVHQMFRDNARTLPLLLAAPPPPALACATLGGVKAPTLVIDGERTRRFFSLISEVVVRCIPGSRLVTIAQATHPMFVQQPAAFDEVLVSFLAQH